MGVLLLAALALPAIPGIPAGAAEHGAGAPALLSVEGGPGGERFTLECRGEPAYRLIQEEDGTLFTIELEGAGSEVQPGELPLPSGIVRAISVGSSSGAATLAFSLHRRAAAVLRREGDALVLRLMPLRQSESVAGGEMRPLGTEDLIEVTVFEVPDLNRTVRIAESGTIALPLIGEMPAAGLTPRELESEIRDLLAAGYVKDPHVSVFVQEHGSKQVSVLGAVGKPGVYQMLGPRTLLQVLAQAGGLTSESGTEIYVIRAAPGGGHDRIPVEIDALVTSSDPSLNLSIEPGDVVSVPADRMISIFVDGAVRTPGRLEQPASREITLMQAVAKAGGGAERANLKKVQVIRKDAGGRQATLVVDLHKVRKGEVPDPVLADGDVVVVPESFF